MFSLSSLLSESKEILLVSDMSWSWRNFFDSIQDDFLEKKSYESACVLAKKEETGRRGAST